VRRIVPIVLVAAVLAACGDGDGDGDATATTVGATTTEASATTGTSAPATTTTCPEPAGEPPVATIDLDGDGVEERWVRAGRGAAVDIVELRRVEGCDEVPVTVDGTPAQFAVGGSVLLLQGVRCEDGIVVHLGATSEDGERYVTLDLRYELRGGELVRVGDRSGELTSSDPELADYSSFDC